MRESSFPSTTRPSVLISISGARRTCFPKQPCTSRVPTGCLHFYRPWATKSAQLSNTRRPTSTSTTSNVSGIWVTTTSGSSTTIGCSALQVNLLSFRVHLPDFDRLEVLLHVGPDKDQLHGVVAGNGTQHETGYGGKGSAIGSIQCA
jgi:hypothetical protein